jgi:hypothetical protein
MNTLIQNYIRDNIEQLLKGRGHPLPFFLAPAPKKEQDKKAFNEHISLRRLATARVHKDHQEAWEQRRKDGPSITDAPIDATIENLTEPPGSTSARTVEEIHRDWTTRIRNLSVRPLRPVVGTPPQLPSFDPEGYTLVESSTFVQVADENLPIDPQLLQNAGSVGDTATDADDTLVDAADLPRHTADIINILEADAIVEEDVSIDSNIVSDFVAMTMDLALTSVEQNWLSKPKLSPAQFDGPTDVLALSAEQFVQFLATYNVVHSRSGMDKLGSNPTADLWKSLVPVDNTRNPPSWFIIHCPVPGCGSICRRLAEFRTHYRKLHLELSYVESSIPPIEPSDMPSDVEPQATSSRRNRPHAFICPLAPDACNSVGHRDFRGLRRHMTTHDFRKDDFCPYSADCGSEEVFLS